MLKRFIKFLRTTPHPERYHGDAMTAPFFEGWYYKVIDSTGKNRFAFIPGLFMGKTAEDSHAFIQVMDGSTQRVEYHRYSIEDFSSAEDRFHLRIGKNTFSLDRIELNIQNGQQEVQGILKFDNPLGWPVRFTSPGVMGWYSWVPRMECYHGVLGFDHSIQGSIQVDGKTLSFDGGRGYMEKDWGKAFPQAWVWIQSNHFEQPRTCLTASVAIIPWLGGAFAGFTVGFWQDGFLHRFATFNNSQIQELVVDDHQVHWKMRNRTHQLVILASQAEGGLLLAPTPQGMGRRIAETLNAKIQVKLINNKSDLVEFNGQGQFAGLETVGDLDKLIKMVR